MKPACALVALTMLLVACHKPAPEEQPPSPTDQSASVPSPSSAPARLSASASSSVAPEAPSSADLHSLRSQRGDRSPHAEALKLVLDTQQDALRDVDNEAWWHDVKQRSWNVKRPFYPGTIDSTHMFVVTYEIDGVVAIGWTVDTGKKTIRRMPYADTQPH